MRPEEFDGGPFTWRCWAQAPSRCGKYLVHAARGLCGGKLLSTAVSHQTARPSLHLLRGWAKCSAGCFGELVRQPSRMSGRPHRLEGVPRFL